MTPVLITGWDRAVPATEASIRSAVGAAATLYQEAYVIVERGEQHYIQTLHKPSGFIIEKREGSAEGHFRAINLITQADVNVDPDLWERLLRLGPKRTTHFAPDEVAAVMCAYLAGEPTGDWLEWQNIKV